MADSTLILDAEINTSDWETGVKTIQSSSRQIEQSARQASEGMDEINKSSTKASGGTGKFAAIAGAMGGLVSTGISMAVDAISNLSGDIIEASDSAQKFASTLSFAGLDTSTIDQLTASTQKYADQTVYDLSDIRNTTAQLAANGVDNYANLAEAAGNLNAVAGGNADTFRSVGMVLTQTAGAGKLTTENWNQLSDAIPVSYTHLTLPTKRIV
jgi:phage tail tape-measure protein